jgi:two-component system response regulator FlrC
MAQILVVDDDEGVRTFIAEALEAHNHEITAVGSGEEAVQQLLRRPFALLITDLRMPGVGGMALLKASRACWPYMKAVVMTAFGTTDTAIEAMKLGVCDLVPKPVPSPQALRMLVWRALRSGHAP